MVGHLKLSLMILASAFVSSCKVQHTTNTQLPQVKPTANIVESVATDMFSLETRWMSQPIDHAHPEGETFEQQIILLKPKGARNDAPVFFMLGNETDSTAEKLIALFKNYGSPKDFIFATADHRGYGQSITEGDQSVPEYVKIDQVLADYKNLIEAYRSEFTGPWIGAGYSYGGSLVIDFASRYPGAVDVVLSSSALITYDFAFSEYGEHAEELLGKTIAPHLQRHMSALYPAQPYGNTWKSQNDVMALSVGLSQIQAMQPLRPFISEIAPLPTPDFLKALDDNLPSEVKSQMNAWSKMRVPQVLSSEKARTGAYNWYTWKYQQCMEVGTFFIGGPFPFSVQDHVDDCKATFGQEPAYLNAAPWNVAEKLKQVTDPIVIVSGGKDPWVRVGVQPDHTYTNIDFMFYPDGLHCPDRYEAKPGREVFDRLRSHLSN